MRYLEAYILLINVISIIVCIADKVKAQRKLWRISEKMLFSLAAIGGAFGMFLTMIIIRHKTKHRSFMVGLPFMFLMHGVLLLLFLQRNA